MGKPKLRHLALFARDPEKLAQFYIDVFDMTIVPESEGTTARYVTDGYFTLAILPHRLQGSAATGLNHFGFAVDDTAAVSARLVKHGVESPKERPGDRPFAELRAVDPEGNWFDLSEHGFETVETGDERASATSRR
jgi:catechol 2,3-dioxygenase-like lactoylglutathione lyase family enzyme